MNKIVVPNYPVGKLPADLRAGLDEACVVTVTLDPNAAAADPAPDDAATLEELFALADKYPKKTIDQIVSEIRALRDEWD